MDLKLIPGTQGFLADEFGNIYNPNLTKRNTSINGDGYITTSVKILSGDWVTFGVQRLVALSHLINERKEGQIEVNHRDMNIENNAKENLEWVTPSQNNIHSEIMRKSNLFPTIIAERNGIAFELYRNAHEASVDLNIPILTIWDSIKDVKEIDGLMFLHRPYNGKLPNNLKMKTSPYKAKRSIKILDTYTGDVETFESFYIAATKYETNPSHLYQSISHNGSMRMFRKKYLIAYAEDDFPGYSEEDLINSRQRGAREVIAYNFTDGLYYIYSSAKEFILKHNLSKKAVTTSLAAGIMRKIDSFVAIYFSPENATKLKTFIEGPATIEVP